MFVCALNLKSSKTREYSRAIVLHPLALNCPLLPTVTGDTRDEQRDAKLLHCTVRSDILLTPSTVSNRVV